jgi:hypothetical protein
MTRLSLVSIAGRWGGSRDVEENQKVMPSAHIVCTLGIEPLSLSRRGFARWHVRRRSMTAARCGPCKTCQRRTQLLRPSLCHHARVTARFTLGACRAINETLQEINNLGGEAQADAHAAKAHWPLV